MKAKVNSSNLFSGVYKGKKVLVTGHTGFKGSWLTLWLLKLGANVAGFSIGNPTNPSNFQLLKIKDKIKHYEGDIRNSKELEKVFKEFKPEIVFHLAAQALVFTAYEDPKVTFDTNLGGTVNVLECIKKSPSVKAAVMITSDKCYQNVEWEWGYRENDTLGGDDPYSSSKACAELACKSYFKSYFSKEKNTKITTVRAGNVIGGGDWSDYRIIPDCVKAWSEGKELILRNPQSTRPWQHVLDPLSGYLLVGANLLQNPENISGEAFNFGPDNKMIHSVQKLIDTFTKYWGKGTWKHIPPEHEKKEAGLLKLCCDKALMHLNWHPTLNFEDTVKLTAEWYKNYFDKKSVYDFATKQIDFFIDQAIQQKLIWTGEQKK